ncbi:MAG: carboxylate--amine ligase [Clostridia bacterium]|nr:carboxylate--amine ligase [Clostridia bacterium]
MKIAGYLNKKREDSRIIDFAYRSAHKMKVRRRMKLDDISFAKNYYREKTGKELNIEDPKTFDEKQWWLKIHYRNPLQTVCADKYKVREYITQCGGESILNELYGVYDNAEQIDPDSLPDSFFLKTNHGCGSNYWCHDKADFPFEKVKKELNKSLKSNYYHESREWPYKNIEPKIIAEAVLTPHDPPELIDFRFLCFSGRCEYLFIDVDTCAEDGRHRHNALRNVYDRNGEYLDVTVTRERFPKDRVVIPDNFTQMRDWAEKLSKPFPFVRVDLYSFDGLIRFGEMTFFHAGGVSKTDPPSFLEELGEKIVLPHGEFVV